MTDRQGAGLCGADNDQSTATAGERCPTRPLHVACVSYTYAGLGGSDRDWVNLANALGPDELRLTWIGIRGAEHLRRWIDDRVLARIVDLDMPPFVYNAQTLAYERRSAWRWTKIVVDHALRSRAPARRLRALFGDDRPDLVVSNTSCVTLGAIVARSLGLPHVWFVKECLDTAVRSCRWHAAMMAAMSDVVIVPSHAVASAFRRACVLPDGNPVAEIRRSAQGATREAALRALGLPADRLTIGQVGGVCRWKGQHLTLEAFRRLSGAVDSPACSLVFLGACPDSYRRELDRGLATAPESWRDSVVIREYEPDDFSLWAALDIVVHPSLLPDPYPNAVREAMILGKPVIASRHGGIPEMIRHGETGLLVEPDNAVQLAGAIERLARSPEERAELGARARVHASEHFDIESCKGAFAAVFRRLAARRGESGRRRGQATAFER